MTIPFHHMDATLLNKARDGNRTAIQEVLGHLEESLRPMAGQDEAIEWLLGVARRIRDGEDPNHAMKWSRSSAPFKNLELERWTWAQWVKTLLDEDNISETVAMKLVGKAAGVGYGRNSTVDNAWKKYRNSPAPTDIFPLPPEAQERIRFFEECLAGERERYRKKP